MYKCNNKQTNSIDFYKIEKYYSQLSYQSNVGCTKYNS